MKYKKLKSYSNTFSIIAFAALTPALSAQEIPTAAGVIHAATSASVTPNSSSVADIAGIQNRAKVFKGRLLAATGDVYTAVTNRDLAGKTPQEVAQILAGPTIGDHVRSVFSVIDVTRPVAVALDPKKDLNIGAVTLSPAAALKAKDIQATTYVSIPNLRLVRK